MANLESFETREQWLQYQREYRKKNRERIRQINKKWRDRVGHKWDGHNPVAKASHALVNAAIKNGILKRMPCEVCGSLEQNRAHHDDYMKPLEVTWFCEKHHREHHNKALK
jgi:hypothetical protein